MLIMNSLIETKKMIDDLLENKALKFASNDIPAPLDEIKSAAQACFQALQRGNKIIFMGKYFLAIGAEPSLNHRT